MWLVLAATAALLSPVGRPAASPARASGRGGPPTLSIGRRSAFSVSVDLGEGGGTVQTALPPLFTDSTLVTVRIPLPFDLHADPVQGVYKVVQDGYGLLVGDVLRAFSTLAMRYDSSTRSVAFGTGLPGLRARASAASPGWLDFLPASFNPATAPGRCLFIADGQTRPAVEDALVANDVERGVCDILMIFERPLGESYELP